MVLGSADPLRATRKQRDKIGEARDGALPTTDFSDFGRPEIWRRCINHASNVNNQHRQQHSSPQRTTQTPRLGHYHEPLKLCDLRIPEAIIFDLGRVRLAA